MASKLRALGKRLVTLVIVSLIISCSNPQLYIGKQRKELALKTEVQMGSDGTVRNGHSAENLSINGVLYVATFKLVGDQWQNQGDVLVALESTADSLRW